jgi:hypothetical protein
MNEAVQPPPELLRELGVLPEPRSAQEQTVNVFTCWGAEDPSKESAARAALEPYFPACEFRFVRIVEAPAGFTPRSYIEFGIDRRYAAPPAETRTLATTCCLCGAESAQRRVVAGPRGAICRECFESLSTRFASDVESCLLCEQPFPGHILLADKGVLCSACRGLATAIFEDENSDDFPQLA